MQHLAVTDAYIPSQTSSSGAFPVLRMLQYDDDCPLDSRVVPCIGDCSYEVLRLTNVH